MKKLIATCFAGVVLSYFVLGFVDVGQLEGLRFLRELFFAFAVLVFGVYSRAGILRHPALVLLIPLILFVLYLMGI